MQRGFWKIYLLFIKEEGRDVSRRHSPLSLLCILSGEDVMFGAVAANLDYEVTTVKMTVYVMKQKDK